MLLHQAHKIAKDLNQLNNGFVSKIQKKSYKGYDVVSEPIELATIKNELNLIYQYHKGFNANVKSKYGK